MGVIPKRDTVTLQEIRKLANGQCIILNRTPSINVLRKKPAIAWIIFFSFNWEKIIDGMKIKEKNKNPDVNTTAAPWRWNAFNRHPTIIIIDEVIPIFSFRLFILLIYKNPLNLVGFFLVDLSVLSSNFFRKLLSKFTLWKNNYLYYFSYQWLGLGKKSINLKFI